VLVTDAPHDAAAVAEAVGNRRAVALACTHANADHLRVAPALAICSTPVIFRSRLHQVRGKYRWVHRTVDRLLVRSRVHGTASCASRVLYSPGPCHATALGAVRVT